MTTDRQATVAASAERFARVAPHGRFSSPSTPPSPSTPSLATLGSTGTPTTAERLNRLGLIVTGYLCLALVLAALAHSYLPGFCRAVAGGDILPSLVRAWNGGAR